MSQPENKKPGTPQADAAATDKSAQTTPPQTPPRKDPNEYDPVGMAGKPAGILPDLGEEGAKEDAKEKEHRNGPVPKDRSERG